MSSAFGRNACSRPAACGEIPFAAPIRATGPSRSSNASSWIAGDDLVDEAAGQDRLAGDDAAAGLADGRQDRLHVERDEAAQVDHLGREAVVGRERLGGGQAIEHGRAPADERHVVAFASDLRHADRARGTPPPGTTPFVAYRPWLSTNMTGLFVRIADLSRPFASAGVEG